jgi:hypothetical protein
MNKRAWKIKGIIALALIGCFVFLEIETRIVDRLGVIATAYLLFNYEKDETASALSKSPEPAHFKIFSSNWSGDKITHFYLRWFGGQFKSHDELLVETSIDIEGRHFVVTKQYFLFGKHQDINVKEGHWEGVGGSSKAFFILDDYTFFR